MWRTTTLVIAACLTLNCFSSVQAQGGGGRGGRGPGGGQGGARPGGGPGMDMAAQAGGNQFNQNNGDNMQMAQAMQNQNQSQNMPTISQLATSLMTTYDTNNSGSLDITELQAALAGLRNLMMSGNQQNGNAAATNDQPMPPPRLSRRR